MDSKTGATTIAPRVPNEAFAVPASRADVPRRLAVRLAAKPFGHPVLTGLARMEEYPRRVRALALAITRAELACRPAWRRATEYVYVWLRLRNHGRVTVGPAQIRLASLQALHEAAPCCAGSGPRSSPRGYVVLPPECYACAVLEHVEQLLAQHPSFTAAANAHNKGTLAADVAVETAYSTVVSQLTAMYSGLLSGVAHRSLLTELARRAAEPAHRRPAPA